MNDALLDYHCFSSTHNPKSVLRSYGYSPRSGRGLFRSRKRGPAACGCWVLSGVEGSPTSEFLLTERRLLTRGRRIAAGHRGSRARHFEARWQCEKEKTEMTTRKRYLLLPGALLCASVAMAQSPATVATLDGSVGPTYS